MKTLLFALLTPLVLVVGACSGDSGKGSGRGGGSFDVQISGAVQQEESGKSAMVYDMAGFTHVGMFARGGDFQVDFNTKGTERPGKGVLELQASNLGGWIASVDITSDAGAHTYNATNGELEITEVDGSRYAGRFDFEAVKDSEPGVKISVSGTFEAFER